VTAKVANFGDKNAGPFYTRFALSYDTYLGNDYALVNLNYQGLQANYYNTTTFTVYVPNSIPAGTYYLIETIDHGQAISETNEYDNSFYFAGPITIPPPSFVGDPDIRSVGSSGDILVMSDLDQEIRSIDFDGETILVDSLNTSITDLSDIACEIRVEGTKIYVSKDLPIYWYALYDYTGKVVCSGENISKFLECDVSSSGIYFLHVIDSDDKQCISKIFIL
jgi:hypothetical protein